MRVSSSRAATAAAVVAGLAVLAVAGRLLPTTPSLQRPATPTSAGVPAGTVRVIPLREVPTSTLSGGVRVPDVIGHTLARATSLLRTAGLRGVAFERDPQIGSAVVVAKEPPAGVLIPRGDVVGLRTRTDVRAKAAPAVPPGPRSGIRGTVVGPPNGRGSAGASRAARVSGWLVWRRRWRCRRWSRRFGRRSSATTR
jgi:hypothetical protein